MKSSRSERQGLTGTGDGQILTFCPDKIQSLPTIMRMYRISSLMLLSQFIPPVSFSHCVYKSSTDIYTLGCGVLCLVTQSCPNLCISMDCSPSGFSVRGILQARTPEWVVISFSRGSFLPRDRTRGSYVSCWQVGSLLLAPPEKIMLRRKREGIKEKFTLN